MPSQTERLTNDELADLYRRYGFLLQRRCRTILRNDAEAADVLQDAFIKFMHAGESFRAAENPMAWMYRVIDHCCFDQLRRGKHRRTEPIEDHEKFSGAHPGVDHEARNAALRILHELTEPEYEVAILAYVDGVSQTDIASQLGLSRPTIWKRLTAVRERAMRVLEGAT